MKRLLSLCLAILFAVGSMPICAAAPARVAEHSVSTLITERTQSFADGEKYSGGTVSPHMNVSDFADLLVAQDGGSHRDGRGAEVFSNYVVFDVVLNFDPSSKRIAGTDVKVSKDRCDWNETPYAASGDTEQYIAYGAIGATRRDGEGNVFHYEPIFSKGNTSVESIVFNEDGDYTVFVLFESVKNGKYQNHVIEWSFSIRSYIYLVDSETGYPIKESGKSDREAKLDLARRSNVTVECVFTDMEGRESRFIAADGYRLSQNGTYRFTVRSNGFVCEQFSFLVDTTDPCERILFANLRRQIGEATYEAEGSFYLTWNDSVGNPITVTCDYYDGQSETPVSLAYTAGTVLTAPGFYFITARLEPFPVNYAVHLIEKDAPAQNREMLTGERFNNFKTKWYQVYDDINGRYLCFDVSEYDLAYEAAMTIENSSVNDSLGTLYYNDRVYPNRIELTAAMHDYAVNHNIVTVYYDPNDYTLSEESERVFSPNAFDGTSYLNGDFCFVSSHPSETERVSVTDAAGNVYEGLEFFVPVQDQQTRLPHGALEVRETDCYGNETVYRVLHDLLPPAYTLCTADGTYLAGADGATYEAAGSFRVASFSDDLDAYAVLRVTRPDGTRGYYYQQEYLGIVFAEKGTYTLCGYDRNGNAAEISVTVK